MEQYLLVKHDLIKFFDMKLFIALFLMVFAFSSCAPTNRIIMIKDSSNVPKGFKLVQNLQTSSSVKTGKVTLNQFFNTEVTYQFKELNKAMPLVSLGFHTTKAIRSDELDSVMVLNLDNEKISVVANENKSYNIPENLWLSISNSKDISYSLSIGSTAIVVKLNPEEKTKVKTFFNRAMQRRLEIIPLLPPGKARW